MDETESYCRRWNLRLFGVSEDNDENVHLPPITFTENAFSDPFGNFFLCLLSKNDLVFMLVDIYVYKLNTENDKRFESLEDSILL